MGLYWEPCPGGARLLRLLGDTPCPAVPGTIEGLPVAELGPYCFADRPVRPGARRTGDDAHEITGNFVEEVTLPDTVRVLDSAAFYNCRRLRRVTLGPGVEGFGSDLFTNCRQLQTFRLRAAADAPTGLKKLLGAVSADITVELDGAQLFYPE
uniref:leucine-rich repeat protein n=2 Tax=Eubacteriales incertae sedis TaxID=538999 RepID=UPI003FED8656